MNKKSGKKVIVGSILMVILGLLIVQFLTSNYLNRIIKERIEYETGKVTNDNYRLFIGKINFNIFLRAIVFIHVSCYA